MNTWQTLLVWAAITIGTLLAVGVMQKALAWHPIAGLLAYLVGLVAIVAAALTMAWAVRR